MVVVLLVVGPERLPVLAGQAGRWIGKARRIIAGIRSDIESEIKAAELKAMLQEQQGEIGELKKILQDTQKELEKNYDPEGDQELIRAVEEDIDSINQELTFSSKPQKHEAD